MKISLFIGIALMLMVFTAGCQQRIDTLDTLAQDMSMLPYKSTILATENGNGENNRCPVGHITVNIQGSGHATRLGRHGVIQSHCVNPADLSFYDGRFLHVAANGDEINGTYFGQLVPIGGGLLEIHGRWMFTAGTGRFSNVQGDGDAFGVLNVVSGEAALELEGWISYAASDRRN